MNAHNTREVLDARKRSVEGRDRGRLVSCAYCDATCGDERAEHGQRTFQSETIRCI
jgi:hypothetical protein